MTVSFAYTILEAIDVGFTFKYIIPQSTIYKRFPIIIALSLYYYPQTIEWEVHKKIERAWFPYV